VGIVYKQLWMWHHDIKNRTVCGMNSCFVFCGQVLFLYLSFHILQSNWIKGTIWVTLHFWLEMLAKCFQSGFSSSADTCNRMFVNTKWINRCSFFKYISVLVLNPNRLMTDQVGLMRGLVILGVRKRWMNQMQELLYYGLMDKSSLQWY
jgi:hypothetical protein